MVFVRHFVCVLVSARVQGWVKHVNLIERSLLRRACARACVHAYATVRGAVAVVLTSEGEGYTFGWCDRGQLGHGDTQNSDAPIKLKHFLLGVDPAKGPRFDTRCVC